MTNAVNLRKLSKSYHAPSGMVKALEDFSLSVNRGEIFGLLGPNGAGKTTAIEIAVGLRQADYGSISILGKSPETNADWIRSHVGVQPQEVTFFPHQKVDELLSFWATLYRDSYLVSEIIQWLGLEDLLSRKVSKLSGGQHQRLNVGLALIGKPKVVFLDEPSTGLDIIAREKLWNALRQLSNQGMTVILSTHNLEEASALCDNLGIINNGKIIAHGKPTELITKHTEGTLINCKVPGSAINSVENELKTLGKINFENNVLSVKTKFADKVLAKLTQLSFVTDIRMQEPGLNEVFKNLVGRDFSEKVDNAKGGE